MKNTRSLLAGLLIGILAAGFPLIAAEVTFNGQIAPLLFRHCSACHRPGQSAPFPLLSYDDAKKKAKEIVEVTSNRVMPPWLPEETDVPFENVRRLSEKEIQLFRQWLEEGTPVGPPAQPPPSPQWPEEWPLGKPDLVATMETPYSLAAAGKDIYRNFVIPLPVDKIQFVRAVEIKPDNPAVVHHAVLLVDSSGAARKQDARDLEPGFSDGMGTGGAQLPDNFFFGWTPGKMPFQGYPNLAWQLRPGTDLVLQLHLRPSGKSEPVRARVGLYFNSKPPDKKVYALVLRSKEIDLLPGEKEHLLTNSFTLPVEVEALSIYPHAHYLGKEMRVDARFPDGEIKRLLWIKQWDFNWQDEYRFHPSVVFPKGTEISMAFSYDNSTQNIRNPSHPPKRVRYGKNSTDEMGEVLLQIVPRTPSDFLVLQRAGAREAIEEQIAANKKRLEGQPADARLHQTIGWDYAQLEKSAEAIFHYREAVRLAPDSAGAHFLLGEALTREKRWEEAIGSLKKATQLKSNQPEVWSSLARALMLSEPKNPKILTQALNAALRGMELSGSRDPEALAVLAQVYAAAGSQEKAVETMQKALDIARENGDLTLFNTLKTEAEKIKMGPQK